MAKIYKYWQVSFYPIQPYKAKLFMKQKPGNITNDRMTVAFPGKKQITRNKKLMLPQLDVSVGLNKKTNHLFTKKSA